MRNEPSILFSMKQTMFFVLKEQLGALKFVERSQETFCGYVPFYTFIVYFFSLTHKMDLILRQAVSLGLKLINWYSSTRVILSCNCKYTQTFKIVVRYNVFHIVLINDFLINYHRFVLGHCILWFNYYMKCYNGHCVTIFIG